VYPQPDPGVENRLPWARRYGTDDRLTITQKNTFKQPVASIQNGLSGADRSCPLPPWRPCPCKAPPTDYLRTTAIVCCRDCQ